MRLITSLLFLSAAFTAYPGERAASESFEKELLPFLQAHCVQCHGPEKQKGKVRLDLLTGNVSHEYKLLNLARDQVRDGLMPPEDAKSAPPADVKRFVERLSRLLPAQEFAADQLPNKGNLVPHEMLFGKHAVGSAASPPRIWRLNSDSYLGVLSGATRAHPDGLGLVKPFTLIPDRGFNDYSALYSMDEPTTEILIRNAALIVERQCAHEVKDGKFIPKNDSVKEFVALMDPQRQTTPAEVVAAAKQQFTSVMGSAPSPEQLSRYEAFYAKCAARNDRPTAVKTLLQAVLLHTSAIFRSELGGALDAKGQRRMLAPPELADALSFALGNKRITSLVNAANKGELSSREQIAVKLRAILDGAEKNADTSRLLGFFRQYFDYVRATDIFKSERFPFPEFANEIEARVRRDKKDETLRGSIHLAASLVGDTDMLVQHVLNADKDVLRTLLTTDRTFVNVRVAQDKATRKPVLKPAFERNAINHRGTVGPQYVYGFMEWPAVQPVNAPADKPRLGILMQPAWLVAHSTNFETDPVRRGRWIRERLLGQAVPDIPIDVAAQVPDEHHSTFRTRLRVTREGQRCWKCHQWMDDLGLPFEQFDHYGVYRTAEMVEDKVLSRQKFHHNGDPIKVFAPVTLDVSGLVALTGDPHLDGSVKDPYELVRRLADSTRVRQVFVRHAFRYFLGRNESASDAQTLQEADKVYLDSGGSFRSLVVSLLTSDSFLYRSTFVESGN